MNQQVAFGCIWFVFWPLQPYLLIPNAFISIISSMIGDAPGFKVQQSFAQTSLGESLGCEMRCTQRSIMRDVKSVAVCRNMSQCPSVSLFVRSLSKGYALHQGKDIGFWLFLGSWQIKFSGKRTQLLKRYVHQCCFMIFQALPDTFARRPRP